ncbi:MAG: hypothetical protein JG770_615 [Mahella sp.]|nr:hypothetical protein [Mahella sp.]
MFKRKVKVMLLVVCLLMVGSVSAFAVTYSFHFEPPFVGSVQHSPSAMADGTFTPYVDPSGTTNATTYVLTLPSPGSIDTVSSFAPNVTSAKTYFTYNSGFGGLGQYYKLTGYPSNSDFQEYYAAGGWKP